MAIDFSPLRDSRDFRLLWIGQLVGNIGRQITVVALPYQVYLITRSSLMVGLLALAQAGPLVVFSLAGGAIADAVDRRRLLLLTQLLLAATSVALWLGALHHASVLFLFAVAAVSAGIGAVDQPARSATVPRLVSRDKLPAALSLQQVLYQVSQVAGPSAGGLVIARFGLPYAYAIDAITFCVALATLLAMSPQPPSADAARPGWHALVEGFTYLRTNRPVLGSFAVDLNAMIFGMPRALFPALATDTFKVGATGLGLLHASVAAGALVGALMTGWVSRIRRQGAAVLCAVAAWGAAICAFGLCRRAFWLGLVFLAMAGAADVFSAVFRNTILQLSVPDRLRGRVTAVHIMVVTGGPRLGDLEAGTVASLVSPTFSVVSGGVACMAGVGLLALVMPSFAQYQVSLDPDEPPPLPDAPP